MGTPQLLESEAATEKGGVDGGLASSPKSLQVEKKRKKGPLCKYGNYNRYYGYRLNNTLKEDPRLKCFRREWFEEKDCLDVGCNEGLITISIGQKFMCRNILGVDIDDGLIDKAVKNLEAAAEMGDAVDGRRQRDSNGLGSRSCDDDGERSSKRQKNLGSGSCDDDGKRSSKKQRNLGSRSCDDDGERSSKRQRNQGPPDVDRGSCSCSESLLQRVRFRKEQFILDFPHGDFRKDGMFDTILCLSVTKWIHLNWGDRGLIRLFAKMYHLLQPGGLLILEPQPWKSYDKKSRVTEELRKRYHEVQLRPWHFKEILLDKIGFKSVEQISKSVPNSSHGFDRELFLYVK